jgi:Ca2+-binding EF-hand superfamily protein
MLSEFQKRKQAKVFEVGDVDKNGVLEQADFERVSDNLARASGFATGSPEHQSLRAAYLAGWAQVQTYAKQYSDRVTPSEWLEARAALINDPALYPRFKQSTVDVFFKMFDANRDGAISCEEFSLFFKGYEIDDAQAEEAFRQMDTNGDGRITREEMFELVEQFHHSQDPSAPGNWLYGKL